MVTIGVLFFTCKHLLSKHLWYIVKKTEEMKVLENCQSGVKMEQAFSALANEMCLHRLQLKINGCNQEIIRVG